MAEFPELLRRNHDYRHLWLAQVVSEIGDHFNNIAVFSLVMQATGSGMVVSGVMLSRAIPAVLAGPVAGVMLDRFDRKRIMIASDLARCAIALGFVIAVRHPQAWLLYLLSALLMFASPFFTSGRAAILPAIADSRELHAANSLTQTTQWATQTFGALLAGWCAAWLGFEWAFVLNSASFLYSAIAIARIRTKESPRPAVHANAHGLTPPWRDYRDGLAYMRATPLVFGIAMLSVGWALGGGAAQILFTVFGEQVFHRGSAGIGSMWGFAGLGLLLGGFAGHALGRRLGFRGYKRTVAVSYVMHGLAYIAFSQAREYWLALLFVCASRVGMAINSVLNYSQLLRHTPDRFRGRVFATLESLRWAVMIASMAAAGVCTQYVDPRVIGTAAGAMATATAAYWFWADVRGKLPSPANE
jgi:Na+/melibiose symporter-like transporter